MNHVNEKMYQFFFSCSKSDRKNLVLSYDFKMVTLKDRQVILSHTIVPYKLCKNSNLWIALCHVSLSPNQEAMHPTLHNRKTGKQYNLINNDFVEVDSTILSSDERMILEWMIKGLSDIAIGERLNIPSTSFKRKKRIMYDKLGANSSSEATYKAHLRGII
ncbi:MAG: LuxR C-terminal-related transcriptional regulator, partial [Bacteroidales bacterium]|jgi:DNA-binding CsgD family transcriptional regulator|nr:LuxR C-terminal-related transcriptional regulator [Bacteroidales bacterium]